MSIEIWRAVVGYEGLYKVSNLGRVQSLPRKWCTGKILTPTTDKKGRHVVTLCADSVGHVVRVHNLVAEAFLGPSNGRFVLHWDDCPAHNHLGNLRYGTRMDNAQDAIRNARQVKGTKQHAAKLSEVQVLDIRRRLTLGISSYAVAKLFGLNPKSVRDIANGKTWGWLK